MDTNGSFSVANCQISYPGLQHAKLKEWLPPETPGAICGRQCTNIHVISCYDCIQWYAVIYNNTAIYSTSIMIYIYIYIIYACMWSSMCTYIQIRIDLEREREREIWHHRGQCYEVQQLGKTYNCHVTWKMMENDGKWWKMMENDGKWWKMMENDGKWWKMMENDGKWWKMMENDGKCMIF